MAQLISADQLRLNLTGDLKNSGTIAGRRLLDIEAGNVENRLGELTADVVGIKADEDIDNIGGVIRAKDRLALAAGRDINVKSITEESERRLGRSRSYYKGIKNVAGLYVTGTAGRLLANARRDVNLVAAVIRNEGVDTTIEASRDINLGTVDTARQNDAFADARNYLKRGYTREVGTQISTAGDLTLHAIGDVNAKAATLETETGDLTITAGNDINLTAGLASENTESSFYTKKKSTFRKKEAASWHKSYNETVLGTSLTSGGNLSITAGADQDKGDLSIVAGNLQAKDDITLRAKGDVSITEARERHTRSDFSYENRSLTGLAWGAAALVGSPVHVATLGAASDFKIGKSRLDKNAVRKDKAIGSNISGKHVTITAGEDIKVTGSDVVSDAGTALSAGGDVSIEAAMNRSNEQSSHKEQKSGLLTSGGLDATFGIQEQSRDSTMKNESARKATVGAVEGKVTILAGEDYKQVGSDVMAPKGDVTIVAKKVDISHVTERTEQESRQSSRQSGITVSLSHALIDSAKTVEAMHDASRDTEDPRMKALAVAAGAMSISQAASTPKPSKDDPLSGTSVTASYGVNESSSASKQITERTTPSRVLAGGTASIVATGGDNSNITITGSDIEGEDIDLKADKDIILRAAIEHNERQSSNESSSASAGLSLSLGSEGAGASVVGNANQSKGTGTGTDHLLRPTNITAKKELNIQSGRDMTMEGAKAKGEKVTVDVARNLTISTPQERRDYESQQSSSGSAISIPIPIPGASAGEAGASASYGKEKIDSRFRSVDERSGIEAGDAGFAVAVQGKTKLTGAVIASTDQAVSEGRNRFNGITGKEEENNPPVEEKPAEKKEEQPADNAAEKKPVEEKEEQPADNAAEEKEPAAPDAPAREEREPATSEASRKEEQRHLNAAELELIDVVNQAEYRANAVAINAGVGSHLSSSGGGVGRASGEASSITRSGISGIAGDKGVRTDDKGSGITPIFDEEAVKKDIGAQVAITQEFSKQASRVIGDYAAGQLEEAREKEAEALEKEKEAKKKEDTAKEAETVRPEDAERLQAAAEEKRKEAEVLEILADKAEKEDPTSAKDLREKAKKSRAEAERQELLLRAAKGENLAVAEEQRQQASQAGEAARASKADAEELNRLWAEGGALRVALHTIVGGLTGNVAGAAGAGISQAIIPTLGEKLAELDLPAPLEQAIIQAAALAIGAAAGGNAGAAAAESATTQNFLFHAEEKRRDTLKEKCEGDEGCSKEEKKELDALNKLDMFDQETRITAFLKKKGKIGILSMKDESGGDAGIFNGKNGIKTVTKDGKTYWVTTNNGDRISFGLWQIAANGSVTKFLDLIAGIATHKGTDYSAKQIAHAKEVLNSFNDDLDLKGDKKNYGKMAQSIANVVEKTEGSSKALVEKFANTFKKLAKKKDFILLQHHYIEKTHYQPVWKHLGNKLRDQGLDIKELPPIMRDVVWSMAVQHGGAKGIITRAGGTFALLGELGEIIRETVNKHRTPETANSEAGANKAGIDIELFIKLLYKKRKSHVETYYKGKINDRKPFENAMVRKIEAEKTQAIKAINAQEMTKDEKKAAIARAIRTAENKRKKAEEPRKKLENTLNTLVNIRYPGEQDEALKVYDAWKKAKDEATKENKG